MAKSDVTRTLALIDAEIEKLQLTRELITKLDAMAQPLVTEPKKPRKPRKPRGLPAEKEL
jgi:hypothetical protein